MHEPPDASGWLMRGEGRARLLHGVDLSAWCKAKECNCNKCNCSSSGGYYYVYNITPPYVL